MNLIIKNPNSSSDNEFAFIVLSSPVNECIDMDQTVNTLSDSNIYQIVNTLSD